MKVKVVALYEDSNDPTGKMKSARGMSWLLEFDNQRILFDVGMQGKILLHNMGHLNLRPDDIDVLALSHAHMDHTGGLPEFLEDRTSKHPLPVIAHPSILERKRAARIMNIGLPELDDDWRIQMHFKLNRAPVAINPFLYTTGEISNRPHKDGTGWVMQHFSGLKWERDPILDDLSLVLETKQGLVVICGCCHAGLLNTLEHVTTSFGRDVFTVLGGTHMRSFQREDMEYVARILENKFSSPRLGVGHCTGKKQIEWLQERFSGERVVPIHVGWNYEFDVVGSIIIHDIH